MSKVELVTEQIGQTIIAEINVAKSIYILTSFVMESGVKVIEKALKEAVERGTEVKLLAGDYLYITQPRALTRLLEIHPRLEIRLWHSKGKSFHPKAYIFETEKDSILIVGSSNLSASALTSGVEWSVKVQDHHEASSFEKATEEFMRLFYHDQTIPINVETIETYKDNYEKYRETNPLIVKEWTELEETELMIPEVKRANQPVQVSEGAKNYGDIHPRPVQHLALEALQQTQEEGYKKAMVVLATGLGKTYLAAFFAKKFKKVLFIAHREEILKQAESTFKHIMPSKMTGLYYGQKKDEKADFLFASIYTLGRTKHLKRFNPEEFDLIVVDEFHHAAANTYQNVITYFEPLFLLGITATPDRMDQKDIYGLCEGNVAYQLHFIEAIQKQWLTPFHYYGIYDETDYSAITWLGTKYDRKELLAVQVKVEVAEKVVEAWKKHRQTRTIGFCSSIEQADFLASYFVRQGFGAISLHSKTLGISRQEAIESLVEGKIDIVFTVDLFNEGVDIPSVDTLLMVRPTESLTIFTQQIGRGLRLHPNKTHCTIIDLIGNYRNADIKLQLFHGDIKEVDKKKGLIIPTVPTSCEFHIDVKAVDLLKELAKKRQPRKEQLYSAYIQLKQELGRRPTYKELHLNGSEHSIAYKQEFKTFIGFLNWANELSEKERKIFLRYESWLIEVERTSMSKSYKMIVLKYMLERGIEHWLNFITPKEVAPFFHKYLMGKTYRRKVDFSDKLTQKLWEYDEKKVAKLIATMPMTKWSGSSKGLVEFEDGVFRFNLDVEEADNSTLYKWTKEICEYRLAQHFEKKQ